MSLITERGFLALSCAPDLDPATRAALTDRLRATRPGAAVVERGTLTTVSWGLEQPPHDGVVLLSRGPRRRSTDLDPDAVGALLSATPPRALAQVLPTFAAAALSGETVRVAADVLGFRHLCHAAGEGWAAVSTAGAALAPLVDRGLDQHGLAVASLLGWQLAQRTPFQGVGKLRPAQRVSMLAGEARFEDFDGEGSPQRISLTEGVDRAARLLRGWLSDYLDDHPDAVLQLTGGQDSRLLLSAIPVARRRGLRSVTLGAAGDPDVEIATSLARRYGMHHELLSVDAVSELDPAGAHDLCLAAARRVDMTADPLAHAALTVVESRADPGPRISGLGGEVARGFYYLGPVTSATPTARRAARLARWRMFVNEAVDRDALVPSFATWADSVSHATLREILTSHEGSWFEATDSLYLEHRMQRWGGITETAVCLDRSVVNPMLDDRFIAIAQGLAPADKARSLFLSRVQLALDEELASVPLEGRPAPRVFAERSTSNSVRRGATAAAKLRRKVVQRARHRGRAPVGGDTLAGLVVTHWRSHPDLLEPVRAQGVVDDAWLDRVLTGTLDPSPATLAFLVNLVAAGAAVAGSVPPAPHTQSRGDRVDSGRARA